MSEKRQIVVALDGSEPSLRALDVAADLASAMGRDLSLLYVFEYHPGVSATLVGLESEPDVDKLKAEHSGDVFQAAEQRLGPKATIARRYVLVGDPAEEIIHFLDQNSETHLVMGRRGISKIRSLLMGSVSQKVTAHTKALVTIV